MALFSKKKLPETCRDIEFSREVLDKNIHKLGKSLYDDRHTEAQAAMLEFVECLRNLEHLRLANPRDVSMETYHYNRGRVDALSSVLSIRDKLVSDIEVAKKKEKAADNKTTRSYIGRHATQAGLAI